MITKKDEDATATAPAEGTAESTPKFMTAEDFNGAMTARERRFEQRITQQISQQLEKFLAARNGQADAAGDDAASDRDASSTQEAGEQQEAPKRLSGPDLALKRQAAKIDALTKQMAAKEAEAAKEKAELLARQERADVIAALAAAGVTTAKGAYATLKDDGRIRRNADGELVMVVVKDYAGTKMDEEVPIGAGIKEWLATDEGKCFLPPRGGGDGSGTVFRGGATRNGAPPSKEEAKREAQRMLTSFILNK